MGAPSPSIVFKIVRKFVKSHPCSKRNGHCIFRDLLCLLVTVVGQMVNPLPNDPISAGYRGQATIGEGMKTFQVTIEGIKPSATFSSIVV